MTFQAIQTKLIQLASSFYASIFGGVGTDQASDSQVGVGILEESLRGSGITGTQDVPSLVIKYINFVLPYLALAAFVGYVVAGVLYITAFGNEEQTGKSKNILIWSTVGLILVIISFTIVQLFTQDLPASLNAQP